MKNLQSFGVQELNAKEFMETQGGWILPAIALVIYLYDNRDKFVEGINDALSN